MKKIILLLLILTTLTNVSCASFPISAKLVISIDTIIPDTTKIVVREITSEYHSRMQKQGFDIDNCMCIDCRNNPYKLSKKVEAKKKATKTLLGTLLVWIWVLGIILGIMLIQWLIRGYNKFNSGPVIG